LSRGDSASTCDTLPTATSLSTTKVIHQQEDWVDQLSMAAYEMWQSEGGSVVVLDSNGIEVDLHESALAKLTPERFPLRLTCVPYSPPPASCTCTTDLSSSFEVHSNSNSNSIHTASSNSNNNNNSSSNNSQQQQQQHSHSHSNHSGCYAMFASTSVNTTSTQYASPNSSAMGRAASNKARRGPISLDIQLADVCPTKECGTEKEMSEALTNVLDNKLKELGLQLRDPTLRSHILITDNLGVELHPTTNRLSPKRFPLRAHFESRIIDELQQRQAEGRWGFSDDVVRRTWKEGMQTKSKLKALCRGSLWAPTHQSTMRT